MHSPNLSDLFSLASSPSNYSSAQSNAFGETRFSLDASEEETEYEEFSYDEQFLILLQMLSDIKYKTGNKAAKRNAKLLEIARGLKVCSQLKCSTKIIQNENNKQKILVQENKATLLVPTAPIDSTKFVAYVNERRKKRILFKGEYIVSLIFRLKLPYYA